MVCHPGEVVVGLSPCPGKDECEDVLAHFVIQTHTHNGGRDAVHLISQSFLSDAETGVHPQERTQEHLVAIDVASEFLIKLGEFQLVID